MLDIYARNVTGFNFCRVSAKGKSYSHLRWNLPSSYYYEGELKENRKRVILCTDADRNLFARIGAA